VTPARRRSLERLKHLSYIKNNPQNAVKPPKTGHKTNEKSIRINPLAPISTLKTTETPSKTALSSAYPPNGAEVISLE